MTTQETRPGDETGAGKVSLAAENSPPEPADSTEDTRPRCARCGHPLALPRSVARAYGRRCWARTAQGQLDARRDAVGRLLGSLARLVPALDADRLTLLSDRLSDSLDAVGGAR